MSNLTGVQHITSKQHVELSSACLARDNSDRQKLLSSFSIQNFYDVSKSKLQCLASGITATEDDGINWDEAEAVGLSIQSQLDGVCLDGAKLKRNDNVKTLETLRPGVKLTQQSMFIRQYCLLGSLPSFVAMRIPQITTIMKNGRANYTVQGWNDEKAN